MSRRTQQFSSAADEILAEVNAAERVKVAEAEAVRAATPAFTSEIGQLLRKVAADARESASDVTLEDLHNFLGGRL